MRILYVAARYDYGDPARGQSFEHYNFYDTLARMGHDIIYFDVLSEYQQRGKAAMNAWLRDSVRAEKPDLLFCVLMMGELDMDTMRDISQNTDTVTFNWFCDDHWRFDDFSRYWAPVFNWVSTTAASALPKYRRMGYTNVIKTQWACNHFLYRPQPGPLEYDVTFVGQPHGNRREVVAALRRAGIDVQTWGYGWESGRRTQEEMIKIFSRSRINLNLSNSSISGAGRLAWLPVRRGRDLPQIKGRNFEIPGCGGFLLSGTADNLHEYYVPGQEIVVFKNTNDLARKIRYYLDHDEERRSIAQAGYARTIAEHTYERRFHDIFSVMGLAPASPVGARQEGRRRES